MIKRNVAVMLLILIAAAFSLHADASFVHMETPYYQILGWSPDETRVLALLRTEDDSGSLYQLAEVDVRTWKPVVLAESGSYMGEELLQDRIGAMLARGYRRGRVLHSPGGASQDEAANLVQPNSFVPAMNQQLMLQSGANGVRFVLQESLPGIEPAVVVIADLDDRLHRECPRIFSSDIPEGNSDLSIREVFVSPTLQWAFVNITGFTNKSIEPTIYNMPLSFALARESSKLLNICGYRLYLKKDYQRAEEQFVQAFYMDRDNAQALYNLACVCALTDRPYDAMDYLWRAIALDPKYKKKAAKDPDFDVLRKRGFRIP